MTKKHKWTVEEENFLIQNAPYRGVRFCMKELNKTYYQITEKCQKLKIKTAQKDFGGNIIPEIIKDYKEGILSINDICRKFKITKAYVNKIAKNNNIYIPRQVNKDWTEQELEYLKLNYQNKTNEELCSHFDILPGRLETIRNKLKLKRIYEDPINLELFYNISKPEVAYFLGYFWADGSIRGDSKQVSLTIQKEDGLIIQNLIHSFGRVGQYEYKRTNKKDIISFKIYSRGLYDFLFDNDYYDKSIKSADKILSKIPENLHYMFFRGFLDGDGCIFLNKKRNKSNVNFTGSYQQDWNFLEKMAIKNNLIYSIYKTIRKDGSKNSRVNFVGLYNSIPLLQYIYKNRKNDKIGLTRKYNKYLELIEKTKKSIDYLIGITRDINYKKSDKNIKVSISQHRKTLPTKNFNNFENAFEYKKELIKKYQTQEFKLRTLINYWDYSNQLNYLLEQDKIKLQSDNRNFQLHSQ